MNKVPEVKDLELKRTTNQEVQEFGIEMEKKFTRIWD